MIEQRQSAVRVRIRVQTRASRTEIVGKHGGALKVRLAAPAVEGAANAELVRYIAGLLRVARSRLRVVTGETGRTKVIEIEGVEASAVRQALLGDSHTRT